MYQISFIMVQNDRIIHRWIGETTFHTKEQASLSAQTVAKAFNGSVFALFYCIVYA